MTWEIYVSGTRIYPTRADLKTSLIPTCVDSLVFEMPEVSPPIPCGSPVTYKLDGIAKLSGYILRDGATVDSGGESVTYEASGKFQLLMDRQIKRNIYATQDPASLIKVLNQPAEIIQFNNKVQIWPLSADTYVSSGAPNQNYGDLEQVYARMLADETDTDIIFQNYDLAWLKTLGLSLNWAHLYLYVYARTGEEPPANVYISAGRVTGAWTENGLTWNNKPPITTGISLFRWDGQLPVLCDLSLTSMMNMYLGGTFPDWFGWNVQVNKDAIDPAVDRGFFAYSREKATANLRPYIKASIAYSGLNYLSATAQYAPALAYLGVDGIMESYYDSGQPLSIEQWFKVDLTEAKTICEAIFYCEDDHFPSKFKVETSMDEFGVYTERYREEANTNPTLRATFAAVSCRYVKVTALSNPGDSRIGWHICECDFYKPADQILPEGTIINVGKAYLIRTDYEEVGDAMWEKCAKPVGFDLWVDTDGKLNYACARGSDKSGSVKFAHGDNCAVVRKERALPEATVVTVLGHGEGKDQLVVTVRNQNAIDALKNAGYGSGIRERVFVQKDLIDNELAQLYAQTVLDQLSMSYELLEVTAVEIPNHLEVGDWVKVQHPPLGIDGSFRIQTLDIYMPDRAFVMQVATRDLRRRDLPVDLLWTLMKDNTRLANVWQELGARTS